MSQNFVIVEDSQRGQTERIALRIAEVLHHQGHKAVIYKIRCLPQRFTLSAYDSVILGCPLHFEKYSRVITKFVGKHRDELNDRASYFYSVSLAAAGDEHGRQEAQGCIDRFLEKCTWKPNATASFAGALPYRDYNPILRWFMKRTVGKAGGETDTSRNYEYTDWDAVEQFARECGEAPGKARM